MKHLAAIPYQWLVQQVAHQLLNISRFYVGLLSFYPDINFTPRQAMDLLMSFDNANIKELLKNGKKISNFDNLTQILSPISLKYKTKLYDNEIMKQQIILWRL